MSSFAIQHAKFEGPLDLLLSLIQERKLHISEVSLAEIADRFIDYAATLEEFPLHESAEFLVVASTLMLIKSRSLLPGIQISEEEGAEIEILEERLRLHALYTDAAKAIGARFGAQELFLPAVRESVPVFAPPHRDTIAPSRLVEILRTILAAIPTITSIPQTAIKKIISLEESMMRLMERVTSGVRCTFREAHGGGKDGKLTVVLSFLALLELVRRGKLAVTQQSAFHDIIIEPEELVTPSYN